MSVLTFLKPTEINEIPDGHFAVVHPLDDVHEKKVNTSALGRMPMTTAVRVSLMALRGYLVLMMFLLLYHVMDLAGAWGQHSH